MYDSNFEPDALTIALYTKHRHITYIFINKKSWIFLIFTKGIFILK